MAAALVWTLALQAGQILTSVIPGTPLPAGGSGDSSGAVVSADGHWVVFASQANNLLAEPLAGLSLNLFVRDLRTGTNALVSAALDGAGGDGASTLPALTADARRVVFRSTARNLVTNLTSGEGDIYLRDLDAGTTTLISVGLNGAGGSTASDNPVITPDGRYVAFESRATNLVTAAVTGLGDLYLRDLQAGNTVLVSAAANGAGGTGRSWNPSLSADGRFVAFLSGATNLTGLTVASPQPIMRDLQTRTNILPAVKPNGGFFLASSANAVLLSSNGQFVVFQGRYPDLTSTNTSPLVSSLYQRDLVAGATRLIATNQVLDTLGLTELGMSPDGRIVVYNQTNQVFAWDRDAMSPLAAVLVSANTNGAPASGQSCMPVVSDDGRSVTFVSNAPDLVDLATPGSLQVYRHDLANGATELISAAADGSGGGRADNLYPATDAAGGTIAFEALDSNLVADDSNLATDVFVGRQGATNIVLVSAHDPGLPSVTTPSGGSLALKGISADGRFVLFTSAGDGLVTAATRGSMNVYLYDALMDTNILVSANLAGDAGGSSASYDPAMTPDGRYVAFVSAATNLVAQDLSTGLTTNGLNRVVCLRDMASGQTEATSLVDGASTLAPGYPLSRPAVSADGRYVAVIWKWLPGYSYSTWPYLFLRDRTDAASITVDLSKIIPPSLTYGGTVMAVTPGPEVWYQTSPPNQGLRFWHYDAVAGKNQAIGSDAVLGQPTVSADGRFVAYWDVSYKLLVTNLVLLDRSLNTSNTIAVVKVAPRSLVHAQGLGQWGIAMSGDGRWIASTSPRNALLAGNTNTVADVVLFNTQQPGNFTIVSVDAQGAAVADDFSDSPQVSADGRYVAFRSYASNLLPEPASGGPQIYLRDMLLGVTRRLSPDTGGQPASSWCFRPAMSSDATRLAFTSSTGIPGVGDFGQQIDPFMVDGVLATGDSNHNGIPDDWELHYFGDLTHDGKADSDGDGASDYAEYVAGTNPMDANSVLRLTVDGTSGGVVTLSWPATALRTYRVQFKNQLDDAGWQDLPGTLSLSAPGRLQIQDPGSGSGPQRYYRVLVSF